jgi:hypothetical protein
VFLEGKETDKLKNIVNSYENEQNSIIGAAKIAADKESSYTGKAAKKISSGNVKIHVKSVFAGRIKLNEAMRNVIERRFKELKG